MSTELEVMALLEEGNPATEVHDAAWADMDAAAYLSSLPTSDARSVELDERIGEVRDGPISWRIAAAAAAAILIGGIALALLNQGEDDVPVITAPSTPTTVSPTSTTVEDAVGGGLSGYWSGASLTLHLGASDYHIVQSGLVTDSGTYETDELGELTLRTLEDSARCEAGQTGTYRFDMTGDRLELEPITDECESRGIPRTGSSFTPREQFPIPESALDAVRPWSATAFAPGRYETTVFQPMFTFVLPPGWRSPAPEFENNFGMERSPAWLVFNTQSTDTVEERVAFYQENEIVIAGEPRTVEMGGVEAVTFDFNVTENLGLFRVAGGSGEATPGETVRVWLVEVEGTVVTIWFGSTRPTFDAMVEDADAIVGSIVWGEDS